MALNVGNPHVVFFVPDARDVDLDALGPRIEHDPAFPERINVNVATVGDNQLKLRTFERGTGETQACGTGACATAVAAILEQGRDPPCPAARWLGHRFDIAKSGSEIIDHS